MTKPTEAIRTAFAVTRDRRQELHVLLTAFRSYEDARNASWAQVAEEYPGVSFLHYSSDTETLIEDPKGKK